MQQFGSSFSPTSPVTSRVKKLCIPASAPQILQLSHVETARSAPSNFMGEDVPSHAVLTSPLTAVNHGGCFVVSTSP